MGEIFAREQADVAMDFTGERMTSAVSGQGDIEVEHFHRYFLAREYCREKVVLDLASGEGYGSAFLSQVAKSVVGLEISTEAVEHANKSFLRGNLKYIAGDVRDIPIEDNTFDIVVSFETIEHIYEQEKFLDEVKRVLKPDGLLIVSTPDRDVYSPLHSKPNEFHKRELTKAEFSRVLRERFTHVDCVLQRAMNGSLMLLDEGDGASAAKAMTFEARGDDYFEASDGLPRAVYLIAFASDHPMTLPSASAYIESDHIPPLRFYQAESDLRQFQERSRSDEQDIRTQASRELEETRAQVSRELEEARAQASREQNEVRSRLAEVEAERLALEKANEHAEAACRTLRLQSIEAQRQIADLNDRVRRQEKRIRRFEKSPLRALARSIRSIGRTIRGAGRRRRRAG